MNRRSIPGPRNQIDKTRHSWRHRDVSRQISSWAWGSAPAEKNHDSGSFDKFRCKLSARQNGTWEFPDQRECRRNLAQAGSEVPVLQTALKFPDFRSGHMAGCFEPQVFETAPSNYRRTSLSASLETPTGCASFEVAQGTRRESSARTLPVA